MVAMPRHVAFLRGINLGRRRVTMDRLRAVFESLGHGDVRTFIASGNVLFDTRARDRAALERRIEAALAAALGFDVPTLVRTPAEVAAAVAHRAFPDEELDAPGRTLHVVFVRDTLDAAAAARLRALDGPVDAFRALEREFHWLCRGKFSDSLVPPAKIERAIGMTMTARNATMLRRMVALFPEARR